MTKCDMNGMVLIFQNVLLASLLTALVIYVQKPVANCNQMAKTATLLCIRFVNGLSLRCKEIFFFMGWWDVRYRRGPDELEQLFSWITGN